MRLCFATNNPNKINEVKALLGESFEIVSLDDLGFGEELSEDFDSLEENSRQKATFINTKFNINCFADDSGLEVYSLRNEPGARSARYAGDHKNNEDNIQLLLSNLKNETDRRARFRTVITLYIDGQEHQFEGIVEGEIINEKRGLGGFGYDPVFIPDGYSATFAQMKLAEKNQISHRGKAIEKLVSFLKGFQS